MRFTFFQTKPKYVPCSAVSEEEFQRAMRKIGALGAENDIVRAFDQVLTHEILSALGEASALSSGDGESIRHALGGAAWLTRLKGVLAHACKSR